MKALLATAHEEGLIRTNPAAGLRLGRTVAMAPVKETRALNDEEVVRVLHEVPERHRLLIELLAQTGLRISEALALKKGDIDFGRRRLRVDRRLVHGELDAPKTRYGLRQAPLSPGLAQKLWARLATADEKHWYSRRLQAGRLTARSCTRLSGRRGSVPGSSGRSGCTHSGIRAPRSCSGGASRERQFGGCLATTRGTSRPGHTYISKMMIFRTAQLSET